MRFVAPIEGGRRRARHLPPARRARRARALQLPRAPAERPHRAGARDGQHRRVQAERARAGRRRVPGWRTLARRRAAGRRPRDRAGRRRRSAARSRCIRASTACSSPARGPRAARSPEATLDQPGKLLALELGGKNAMIVCADADLDSRSPRPRSRSPPPRASAARALSRIFVERRASRRSQERLARVLAGLAIGPPLEPGVFMGPLVSRAAHEKRDALARAVGGGRRRARVPTARSTASRRSSRPASCASTKLDQIPSLPARGDLRPRGRALPGRRPRPGDRRRQRLRLRPRRLGDDARPRVLRALRRAHRTRRAQLEPRHDRRERAPALRRRRAAAATTGPRRSSRRSTAPCRSRTSSTRAASTRRRCRPGCRDRRR